MGYRDTSLEKLFRDEIGSTLNMMDKYEYKLKIENIKKLVAKDDTSTAIKIANSVEWTKVKDVKALTMVADLYTKNQDYEQAMVLLGQAYKYAPIGRLILYQLTELAILIGRIEDAEVYYEEFLKIAPDDDGKYILQYKIQNANGAPVTDLIPILEAYLEEDFEEEWAYELASLYYEANMRDDVAVLCDYITLWFHSGEYVDKAIALKKKLKLGPNDKNYRKPEHQAVEIPKEELTLKENEFPASEIPVAKKEKVEIKKPAVKDTVKKGTPITPTVSHNIAPSRKIETKENQKNKLEQYYKNGVDNDYIQQYVNQNVQRNTYNSQAYTPTVSQLENENTKLHYRTQNPQEHYTKMQAQNPQSYENQGVQNQYVNQIPSYGNQGVGVQNVQGQYVNQIPLYENQGAGVQNQYVSQIPAYENQGVGVQNQYVNQIPPYENQGAVAQNQYVNHIPQYENQGVGVQNQYVNQISPYENQSAKGQYEGQPVQGQYINQEPTYTGQPIQDSQYLGLTSYDNKGIETENIQSEYINQMPSYENQGAGVPNVQGQYVNQAPIYENQNAEAQYVQGQYEGQPVQGQYINQEPTYTGQPIQDSQYVGLAPYDNKGMETENIQSEYINQTLPYENQIAGVQNVQGEYVNQTPIYENQNVEVQYVQGQYEGQPVQGQYINQETTYTEQPIQDSQYVGLTPYDNKGMETENIQSEYINQTSPYENQIAGVPNVQGQYVNQAPIYENQNVEARYVQGQYEGQPIQGQYINQEPTYTDQSIQNSQYVNQTPIYENQSSEVQYVQGQSVQGQYINQEPTYTGQPIQDNQYADLDNVKAQYVNQEQSTGAQNIQGQYEGKEIQTQSGQYVSENYQPESEQYKQIEIQPVAKYIDLGSEKQESENSQGIKYMEQTADKLNNYDKEAKVTPVVNADSKTEYVPKFEGIKVSYIPKQNEKESENKQVIEEPDNNNSSEDITIKIQHNNKYNIDKLDNIFDNYEKDKNNVNGQNHDYDDINYSETAPEIKKHDVANSYVNKEKNSLFNLKLSSNIKKSPENEDIQESVVTVEKEDDSQDLLNSKMPLEKLVLENNIDDEQKILELQSARKLDEPYKDPLMKMIDNEIHAPENDTSPYEEAKIDDNKAIAYQSINGYTNNLNKKNNASEEKNISQSDNDLSKEDAFEDVQYKNSIQKSVAAVKSQTDVGYVIISQNQPKTKKAVTSKEQETDLMKQQIEGEIKETIAKKSQSDIQKRELTLEQTLQDTRIQQSKQETSKEPSQTEAEEMKQASLNPKKIVPYVKSDMRTVAPPSDEATKLESQPKVETAHQEISAKEEDKPLEAQKEDYNEIKVYKTKQEQIDYENTKNDEIKNNREEVKKDDTISNTTEEQKNRARRNRSRRERPLENFYDDIVDVVVEGSGYQDRPRMGSFVIQSEDREAGFRMAMALLDEISELEERPEKILKTTGARLNRNGIEKSADKLNNTILIIEQAGRLEEQILVELNRVLRRKNLHVWIVLIDSKEEINSLFATFELLEEKFVKRFTYREETLDELFKYAVDYAQEYNCVFSDSAIQWLKNKIEFYIYLQDGLQRMRVESAIDRGVERVGRKTISNLTKRTFRIGMNHNKQYILKIKDLN